MFLNRGSKRLVYFIVFLFIVSLFLLRRFHWIKSFSLESDLAFLSSDLLEKSVAKRFDLLLKKGALVDLDSRKLSPKQSAYEDLYDRYARSIEVECTRWERLGHLKEGGWSACLQGNFNFPLFSQCRCPPTCSCKPSCLVYSFGINDDWSFDDAIVNRFDCFLRAFDPSLNATSDTRGERIRFYKEGLAGKDRVTLGGWRVFSLASLLNRFNENEAVIDYLKIDVEYWEWESLQAALKQGALRHVKQLGIEVHRDEMMFQATSFEHYNNFFGIFLALRQAGFYKWYSHLNPLSLAMFSIESGARIDCCHEFVFLNMNFAD